MDEWPSISSSVGYPVKPRLSSVGEEYIKSISKCIGYDFVIFNKYNFLLSNSIIGETWLYCFPKNLSCNFFSLFSIDKHM